MLSENIKSETLRPHQQLEKHLIKRIKSIQSSSDYTGILKDFYGFISPLEKHIVQHINQAVPDLTLRRKSEALLADIRFFEDFNVDGADLCPQNQLPLIRSQASAMGALYVLEGSTLGGEMITGLVSKMLHVSTANGFSFFRSYDGRRMEMWHLFTGYMRAFNQSNDSQELIFSAKQTFENFYHWLIRHENNKQV